MIWLYGVTDTLAPLVDLEGSWTTASFAGLHAVGETMDRALPLSADSLQRHDRAVRSLAALSPAFLPMRFAQTFADAAEVAAALAEHREALANALAEVHGRTQMTLRWFGEPSAAPAGSAPTSRGTPPPFQAAESTELPALSGPGASYLAARVVALRAEALPETEVDRARLAPWVRAERLRRGTSPGLVGTAYHLVAPTDVPAYTAAVALAAQASRYRLRSSGPWPAYAFAPALQAP